MSLWTPYAEAPLDLTKAVKYEHRSPPPAYYCPQYSVTGDGAGAVYACCPPPSAQLSPLSGCSGCELASPALSPPESPASLERPPVPQRSFPTSALDPDTLSDDPDFQSFERDALRAMAERNGGSLLGNNPRMRRAVRSTHSAPDDTYRQQRERNNFAAKQSRDRRKLREIHLALKVAYLKNELAALRARAPASAPALCPRCRRPCAC